MPRSILEELKRRISYLQSLSFDDAPSRFDGFLSWMESEPATLRVITTLRESTDIDKLTEGCKQCTPPKVKSPEDAARIGLLIFEQCRDYPDNLPGLLFGLGCHNSQYNDFHADFSNALGKYVNPFLAYLQEELQAQPDTLSIDSVIEYRRDSLLDASFSSRFPETARLWRNLSKELTAFTDSENWFNIANSCREVLKQLSQELLQSEKGDKPDELKLGDFKGLIKHLVANRHAKSRESEALTAIASASWDYVQSLLHNNNASRSQAIRAYLWTGMILAEIHQLERSAHVQV